MLIEVGIIYYIFSAYKVRFRQKAVAIIKHLVHPESLAPTLSEALHLIICVFYNVRRGVTNIWIYEKSMVLKFPHIILRRCAISRDHVQTNFLKSQKTMTIPYI